MQLWTWQTGPQALGMKGGESPLHIASFREYSIPEEAGRILPEVANFSCEKKELSSPVHVHSLNVGNSFTGEMVQECIKERGNQDVDTAALSTLTKCLYLRATSPCSAAYFLSFSSSTQPATVP